MKSSTFEKSYRKRKIVWKHNCICERMVLMYIGTSCIRYNHVCFPIPLSFTTGCEKDSERAREPRGQKLPAYDPSPECALARSVVACSRWLHLQRACISFSYCPAPSNLPPSAASPQGLGRSRGGTLARTRTHARSCIVLASEKTDWREGSEEYSAAALHSSLCYTYLCK